MSQSTVANSMKLKINKACDLSSISVLPPHSRMNPMVQVASQLRSQSQNSFSQANSLSQISQSSFDETLNADQRFDSQEREKPSKRISSLPPLATTRDESQLQLSRTSNSIVRRWGTASAPDSRCQISEELENRFRHMENLLNRLGMIVDSVQSDVIQVNRAVKEVALETEGVRQKIIILDNSMQQVVKEEEELKAFLDASLKAIPNQILDSDHNSLNEIASTIKNLPKRIEAYLVKLQHEVCMTITKKLEIIASSMKSSNVNCPESVQSPNVHVTNIMSKCYVAAQQSLKSQKQNPMLPPVGQARITPVSKMKAEIPAALERKLTGPNHNITLKTEEIPFMAQEEDFRVIIDSDESDGGLSHFLVSKETGKSSCLIDEEAREETIRILRKARKRKRKQSNCITLD